MNNKKANVLIILLFTIICCQKNSENNSINISDKSIISNISSFNTVKLKVPYKKLEVYIGENFIPLASLNENLDNDSDEEMLIAYKMNNTSPVDIKIFDLLENDNIKEKYEFKTEIYNSDFFTVEKKHLSNKDDFCIIADGKTNENFTKMYIFSYFDDEYKVLADYTAYYSILINFEDIEEDEGKTKYVRIRDINVIDNDPDSENPNIQKKETFKWDILSDSFKLVKSEQIFSSTISSIDQSIFYSEEKYFNFIKGFWYPQAYKNLIESGKLDPVNFTEDKIKFVYISDSPREISVKYGDYVSKYSVIKIARAWNQKPGIRVVLKENTSQSPGINKFMDLTLLEKDLLSAIGPEHYDNGNYIKLPKPFEEYIKEKNDEIAKKKISEMTKYIKGTFNGKDNVVLTFENDREFKIQSNNKTEKGSFKITSEKQGFIISFMFENQNTILKNGNFLLKTVPDKYGISLVPVKFDYNGIIIDDLNPINFYQLKL